MMDLLYQFTEWLRTTPAVELSLWISETWLSLVIVNGFWIIPTIQTIHILCLGLAFGALLMINLRVLGYAGMYRNLAETRARYMPWMKWAFVGLFVSGMLLIIGEPVRELVNPIFWIKIGLVVIAVIAGLAYDKALATRDDAASLRTMAIVMFVLWTAIVFGGRWIAYAPV